MARDYGRKYGTGMFRRFAPGQTVQLETLPSIDGWPRYHDFGGGYDSRDASEDTPDGYSPSTINMEVSRKGRLVRAPGTTTLDLFAARTVTQIVTQASLDARAELILFAPPELGVKTTGAPTWSNHALTDESLYSHTNFGGTLIFSNGRDKVYKREPRGDVSVTTIPTGHTFTVFAGRLFVGAVEIDGRFEPMGLAWSGTSGDPEDFVGDGSGAEVLITESSVSDRVVALRAMNFDFMAIVCRHSIWVGKFTGFADRPAHFESRKTKAGAINDAVVQLTSLGVMMLSDDGVRLFDGNEAPVISEQINSDLLPLDYDKLDEYSATHDLLKNRYLLHTPTGTWVYDIQYSRWYKRSHIVKSGTVFAAQFAGKTWADMAGFTWASQAGKTWADFATQQSESPDLVFLGNNDTEDLIAKEDYGSELVWGFPTTLPYWDFPVKDGAENILELDTVMQILYRYVGSGTVRIYLPDNNGQWDLITQQQLVSVPVPTTVQLPVLHTGLGVGLRVEYGSGQLQTLQIQLGVVRQGPRIDTSLSFPREYYPDFGSP